jgi:hypothetical protein
MFIDSDDDITDDMIGDMVKKAEGGYDLVSCGMKYVRMADKSEQDIFVNRVDARRRGESRVEYIVRLIGNDGRLYGVANKIFRMDVVKKNRLRYREGVDFGEDLLFVVEYLLCAGEFGFIYQPLYIYRYGTETSVVKKSALMYGNWRRNYELLVGWVGLVGRMEDLMGWIKCRWFVSYGLAVCRSKKELGEKLKLMGAARKNEDKWRIGRAAVIGKEKMAIEVAVWAASKTTWGLYVLIYILMVVKKSGRIGGNY